MKDVTVINGETCVTQHKLLLCKIEVNTKLPNNKKAQFRNRCRLWRLKKKDISAKFEEEIRLAADKRTVGDVDSTWNELKECLTNAANKICGRAKGKNKKRVTWWWNNEVAEAIKKKRTLYRTAYQTKKEEDKVAYNAAKVDAKRTVAKAKEVECRRFGDELDREDGRKNIFRIAKQMTNQNRDVIGSSYIRVEMAIS